ncbi:elongator complex protein 4 [Platysternon megacephalum]|uniref:Elongator complex protein 4 n=1 Tax=Platysternon megacephalum TaxID=55544 RepID=A0A4D9EMY3_9SAUR|nr:elongator complex protein 4 [Platysternon megacephalum]
MSMISVIFAFGKQVERQLVLKDHLCMKLKLVHWSQQNPCVNNINRNMDKKSASLTFRKNIIEAFVLEKTHIKNYMDFANRYEKLFLKKVGHKLGLELLSASLQIKISVQTIIKLTNRKQQKAYKCSAFL